MDDKEAAPLKTHLRELQSTLKAAVARIGEIEEKLTQLQEKHEALKDELRIPDWRERR